MITADALLAAAFTGESLIVDVENRKIHIPESITHLGVESDEDVMKLLFDMPRFYGDVDLSEFEININYKNARGGGDVFKVEEKVVGEEVISFSWLIGRFVTAYPGNVKFSICLKKPDISEVDGIGQEFNTQPEELPVLTGLETGVGFTEGYPSLYEDLLLRIRNLENKLASGGGNGNSTNYVISGKWAFKSPVNLAGATGKCSVSQVNIKTGSAYDMAIVGIVAIDGIGIGYGLSTDADGTIMVTDVNGVWVDDNYRYLDFGTATTVSAEFYTWFMSNATKASPEASYSISGKWILNSPVNLTGATGKCSIRNVNIKTGYTYGVSVYSMAAIEGIGIGYGLDALGENTVMPVDYTGVFTDEKYRYLDFGSGVVVPKEFYDWFTATAVQGVYEGVYDGDVDITDPDNPVVPEPDEPDEPDVPVTPTTYRITNNFVACSTSNGSTTVNAGASYSALITANAGYTLSSVTVYMGGVDITSGAYSDGVVAIFEVTGDIVIAATATAVSTPTTYYALDIVANNSVSVYINHDTSKIVSSNGSTPLSIWPCASFKLVSPSLVTIERFTAGNLLTEDAAEIVLVPDADGWYTLNQVTTVHINVKPVMYTIEGKYLMNDTVTLPTNSVRSGENNEGGTTGSDYSTRFEFMIAIGTGLFYHIGDKNVHVATASGSVAKFTEVGYRYINFAEQMVSEAFYKWLTANAMKV